MTFTPSQLKKLEWIKSHHDVLESYETKEGYLAVKTERPTSKKYPTGLYIIGRRGGDIGVQLFRPDGTKAVWLSETGL